VTWERATTCRPLCRARWQQCGHDSAAGEHEFRAVRAATALLAALSLLSTGAAPGELLQNRNWPRMCLADAPRNAGPNPTSKPNMPIAKFMITPDDKEAPVCEP